MYALVSVVWVCDYEHAFVCEFACTITRDTGHTLCYSHTYQTSIEVYIYNSYVH